MKNTILVLGASGSVSLEAARQLAKKEFEVFVGTKNLTKAVLMNIPGVKFRHFDYTDPLTYDAVFEGIESVLLVSPPVSMKLHSLVEAVIDQAINMNVQQIVNVSMLGIGDDKHPMRIIERRIEDSGLMYSILRPNCYMQNFNTYFKNSILSEDKIKAPVGNTKTSFIDIRDVAEIAVKLITNHFQENKTFILTGDQAITMKEAARIISSSLNRDIKYEIINENDYSDYLADSGINNSVAEQFFCLCQFINQGWNSVVTGDVEFLLGRKPISFETYAYDFRGEWMPKKAEKKVSI